MALKKTTALVAIVFAALLTLGTAAASANGGGRGHGARGGPGGASISTLVTRAAAQLEVTRANLVAAIRASANARINAAVEDEDIDADEAAEVKEEVAENLRFAYGLSRASTVASSLKITTAALNNGFRAARRAIITARIDAALEDGDITAEQAARAKARIKAGEAPLLARPRGPRGPHGFAFGRRGHGGPPLGLPLGPRGTRENGGPFAPAAKYLGLTQEQLLTQLGDGKSLADIAKAQGKSVDGLKQAILSAMTAELKEHVDNLVDRASPFRRP